MAKPAKFDRQDVIDKAMSLYWQRGYYATSMRDLQEQLDMRPGSIYAAFESKNGLFKAAVRHYTDQALTLLRQLYLELDDPLETLRVFINQQVVDNHNSAPNNMCMLTKTLGELTSDDQDLIDATKTCFAEVTYEFEQLFNAAQQQGQISQVKTAKELAQHLQIQIAGLRTFSKLNDDKPALQRLVDELFNHYPFGK